MLGYIFEWINSIIWFFGFMGLATFFVPYLLQAFVWNQEQNLKKKYNAKWALVTGASSGIGRALVEKLAKQGLNIVLVALDDSLLKDFSEKIRKDYPNLEFRIVGVDLGVDGYMEPIKKATDDIQVQLIFNNAGYVLAGFFSDIAIERHIKNVEVNSISSLKVTHHFVNKLIAAKLKGCICFTSSPSGTIPTPLTAMYGATKAFLTNFGSTLAAEVYKEGIDVCVAHPSPVDTNFYKGESIQKMDLLVSIGKKAAPPTLIASTIISSVGRGGPVREQGIFAIGLRVLNKLLDFNFWGIIYMFFLPLQKEYKNFLNDRTIKKKSQ